ncbi:hypothetical protein Btru_012955 [Bulinus truncatus]|nr:hypothetical protein Btru_012955 [Bulinus truncatus]
MAGPPVGYRDELYNGLAIDVCFDAATAVWPDRQSGYRDEPYNGLAIDVCFDAATAVWPDRQSGYRDEPYNGLAIDVCFDAATPTLIQMTWGGNFRFLPVSAILSPTLPMPNDGPDGLPMPNDGPDGLVTTVARVSYNQPAVARVPYNQPAVARVSYNQPAVARVSYNQPAVARVSYNQPAVARVSYNQPAVARVSCNQPAVARVSGVVHLTFITLGAGSRAPPLMGATKIGERPRSRGRAALRCLLGCLRVCADYLFGCEEDEQGLKRGGASKGGRRDDECPSSPSVTTPSGCSIEESEDAPLVKNSSEWLLSYRDQYSVTGVPLIEAVCVCVPPIEEMCAADRGRVRVPLIEAMCVCRRSRKFVPLIEAVCACRQSRKCVPLIEVVCVPLIEAVFVCAADRGRVCVCR